MVLPIVIVTWVGLSGWTIGTRNSSSRRCQSTWQSLTEYPSLGSNWCINLPSWWPSIRLDNPDPPLGSWYVSRHRSAVQNYRRSRIVPSNMFGCSGCSNSLTYCSPFSAHGRFNSPTHFTRTKSCLSSSKWIGFSGMLGVTFRSEIALVYGGAILVIRSTYTEPYTQKPSLRILHSHFSSKLSREGAGSARK